MNISTWRKHMSYKIHEKRGWVKRVGCLLLPWMFSKKEFKRGWSVVVKCLQP